MKGSEIISLIFALKQRNRDQVEKIFWNVSTPTSPSFRQYISHEQIADLVSASPESIAIIRVWLHKHHITQYALTTHRDWIKANMTIDQASKLLGGIEFSRYYHRYSTTLSFIRSLDTPYSVPPVVANHLDFIGGIHRLPRVRNLRVRPTPTQGTVTPAVIKSVFNVNVVGKSSKEVQAVAQFLGQYYNPSDLATFQSDFEVPVQPVTFVDGPNQPENPGIEANLDIQYIMGVANNVPTWFESTSGEHQGQEPFLQWITTLSGLSNAPYVNSVSYGDVESSVTADYANRVNVEFMKFGMTGRTIIFASGDDGVGCNAEGTFFQPNYPASSPYVTAVGGVVLESQNPLQIVSDSISSGGFSNYFTRPSFQTAAVTQYLASGNLPPSSFYNTSGRAIPDVSSFSEDVVIVYEGGQTWVGGTSCAAPVFSAIISLVNDLRFQHGKVSLGYLNPTLYSLTYSQNAFTDITQGPDNGDGACSPGFSPATGWDPITGLGTPNYPGLATALGSQP